MLNKQPNNEALSLKWKEIGAFPVLKLNESGLINLQKNTEFV